MKVAMVCRNLPFTKLGGMETHTWELATALAAQDIEIDMFTMSNKRMRANGIDIYRLKQRRTGNDFIDRQLFASATKNLARLKYDVYHFQGLSAYGFSSTQLPFIYTAHGVSSFHGSHGGIFSSLVKEWKDYQEEMIVHRAKEIIAVSKRTMNDIITHYPSKEPYPITIIPDGVRLPSFYNQLPTEPRDTFNFLFVGRLSINKGLNVLLKAFQRLPKKEARLTIIGNGPLKKSVERAWKRDKRISWIPKADDKTLWSAYKNCDAFVMPSTYEGFGIAYLEAMACGKPVIATLVGAVDEELPVESVIPMNSPVALAEAMRIFYENPEVLKAETSKIKKIAQEFSWGKIAKRTIAVYKERWYNQI